MIMVLLFGHHGHVQLPEFRSYGARGRTVIAGEVAMAIEAELSRARAFSLLQQVSLYRKTDYYSDNKYSYYNMFRLWCRHLLL